MLELSAEQVAGLAQIDERGFVERVRSGTTGQTFSLSGWFYAAPPANNGLDQVTLVTFSVNWNNTAARYNSITTWSGLCQITNNVPTITALYYYSNAFAQYSWKHVNVGQDIFHPIAP
ncbi:exported avidin family protein [Burkholderia pseudomallei]|nr:exported avidin family protein [Burkholderia pseudomallei]